LNASDFTLSDTKSHYAYTSGAQLNGFVATATLSLGAASSPQPVSFEAVQTVDCADDQPKCPASKIALADYGIGGSGFPKQGFKAIVGTSFLHADVDNPLLAMGVDRWIVEVPRSGEAQPGKLILNPSEEEVADYIRFEMAGPGGAIPGCLINNDLHETICGRVFLDTGAPGVGLELHGPAGSLPWPVGAHAVIVVQNAARKQTGVDFVLGSDEQYRLFISRPSNLPSTRISSALPFSTFSVLFDPSARVIGLKAR
jgi:hypothetical protein